MQKLGPLAGGGRRSQLGRISGARALEPRCDMCVRRAALRGGGLCSALTSETSAWQLRAAPHEADAHFTSSSSSLNGRAACRMRRMSAERANDAFFIETRAGARYCCWRASWPSGWPARLEFGAPLADNVGSVALAVAQCDRRHSRRHHQQQHQLQHRQQRNLAPLGVAGAHVAIALKCNRRNINMAGAAASPAIQVHAARG